MKSYEFETLDAFATKAQLKHEGVRCDSWNNGGSDVVRAYFDNEQARFWILRWLDQNMYDLSNSEVHEWYIAVPMQEAAQ